MKKGKEKVQEVYNPFVWFLYYYYVEIRITNENNIYLYLLDGQSGFRNQQQHGW